MSHVFISYSSRDMENEDGILRQIVGRLRSNFNIWLDKTDLTAGTDWQEALHGAVKSSRVVVFFVSPASVESKYCKAEIAAAQNADIPVIPYVYQDTDLPFGLLRTQAIFHTSDHPIEKLQEALREHAPETYVHGDARLLTEGLLHNRERTFASASERFEQALSFKLSLDDETEIELVGLPLMTTSYCSSYLVGRADDDLRWRPTIQLALQFSGPYRSAGFPLDVAKHFMTAERDFPLRLLLVYGPPQIVYNQRNDSTTLQHVLEMPNELGNPWQDAVKAVQKSLQLYHKDREQPNLQIFMLGPVAGIAYELGSSHRNLYYHSEHYAFERADKKYYRVLGNIG